MVIRGMERLLQVTDKVEQELEGDNLFLRVNCRVGQLCRKFLDLIDNAVLFRAIGGRGAAWHRWMTKAGLVEVRSHDLYVDKMPLARLLSCAILVRVTELVSPGCGSGDVMCGERVDIRREQSTDLLADGGFEISLRDQGDSLVSLITPSPGGAGRHGVKCKKGRYG